MQAHFAAPRLGAFKKFFKTSSETEVLGCYAWNQAVASALFPLLGDFEVALRNALHGSLSRHYGGVNSFNWMLPVPNPAHPSNPNLSPTLPSLHGMTQKTRTELVSLNNKIAAVKQAYGQAVTPDDIIAGVHFGFWEQIIRGLNHPVHANGLQQAVLCQVFPHAPGLSNGDDGFKNVVLNLLKRFREVRNRIGHHESVLRTPEFNMQGTVGFIPRKPRHTVSSLSQFCERLLKVAGWIDPAIAHHMKQSDHWTSFQALLTRDALAAYRMNGGRSGTYQELLAQAILKGTPKVRSRHISGSLHRGIVRRSFHY